jgi:hypothetical protein
MRKVITGLSVVVVLLLATAALMAEEEANWLDPANCHFCQPLTEPEGMMDHLGWNNYKITNGIVSVTTYGPEWKEPFQAASAKMMKLWQEYDPTQQYHLCGMCQAYMGVDWTKVTMDNVDFEGGQVGITTTTDPEVLKQLHAIVDRTNTEYKAMMEAGHEGHEH